MKWDNTLMSVMHYVLCHCNIKHNVHMLQSERHIPAVLSTSPMIPWRTNLDIQASPHRHTVLHDCWFIYTYWKATRRYYYGRRSRPCTSVLVWLMLTLLRLTATAWPRLRGRSSHGPHAWQRAGGASHSRALARIWLVVWLVPGESESSP